MEWFFDYWMFVEDLFVVAFCALRYEALVE